MSQTTLFRAIEKAIDAYAERLKPFTNPVDDTRFNQTPPAGGWSYSEVYSHILDSTLLSLMAAANCLKGEGKNEKTAFAVKVILFFGMLPPGKRYKVPKRLADRVKKITVAEAQQLIEKTRDQVEKLKAEPWSTSTNSKVAHPRLGYLNARQWLRFIAIHFNHHLKQLTRIDRTILPSLHHEVSRH